MSTDCEREALLRIMRANWHYGYEGMADGILAAGWMSRPGAKAMTPSEKDNATALRECLEVLEENRPEGHPPLDIQERIEEALKAMTRCGLCNQPLDQCHLACTETYSWS